MRERFGRLDALVNNAGILLDGGADAARLLDLESVPGALVSCTTMLAQAAVNEVEGRCGGARIAGDLPADYPIGSGPQIEVGHGRVGKKFVQPMPKSSEVRWVKASWLSR